MENENNNQMNKYNRNLIIYFVVVLIGIFLLNSFVMPRIFDSGVQEVSYSTFIDQLEQGDVDTVELRQYEIIWAADETPAQSRPQFYKTARIDDPLLVERLNMADVTFGQEIYEPASPILTSLLSFVLPLLIFWGLGYYLMKKMRENLANSSGGSSPLSFGDSGAKIYSKTDNSRTFDDVAGQEEAKDSLLEVVDYLEDPEKYGEIGARPPQGILLVGPPGTGKTLMAQAVAGEADVPFFSISGSEFVEMFAGRGAAKVRDLFKQANEKAPCIVFIDEIDTIGKKRDSGISSNDEREQTLNQLLTEMDGFDTNKGVILLAATNRPEILDKALLRPGRFDRQVRMELPDLQGRIDILRVHLENYQHADDLDLHLVARMTSGASGAELANIVNEGALRAVREGRNEISLSDLTESVEVVIAGAERKNAILSDEEKEIVAYHEIGHALVAASQEESAPVQKITIVPRTSGALGYVMQVDEDQKSLYSKEELNNQLITLAGGRAAEEIIFDSITTGASNDIEKMTKIARGMVSQYGMSDKFGMMQIESQTNPYLSDDTVGQVSGGMQEEVDQEVLGLIHHAYKEAKRILTENMDKLHELATFLKEEETITGDQFMEILES